MIDIEGIRTRLHQAFRPDAAQGFDHVYQFRFDDDAGAAFYARIHEGELEVGAGEHPEPALTFLFDTPQTAIDVMEGRIDGTQAFMQGRIRTDGNLILALQLGRLFGPYPAGQ